MTLPASGAIGMAGVRAELGLSGTISLNDAPVRELAGIAAGEIDMADLYGKSGPGLPSDLTAVGVDGAAVGKANGAGPFIARAYPSVNVTGGTAPITYLWTITVQDDNGFALKGADEQQCLIEHSIGKYGYQGGCSLTCQVIDAVGTIVTVDGVRADFDYQYGIVQ